MKPQKSTRRLAPKNDEDNPSRNFAEQETDRDLDKPIEQLLSDVHEALGGWRRFITVKQPTRSHTIRKATDLILYSFGRTASMQAVVALENRKTQTAIRRLTRWVVVLTAVLVFLTGVLVWAQLRSPGIALDGGAKTVAGGYTQGGSNSESDGLSPHGHTVP